MKNNLPQKFFLLIVLLVTLSFFKLVSSFFLGIFWAVVLAILFKDWYSKILGWVKGRKNLAAALVVLSIICIIVIPIILVGTSVTYEVISLSERVETGEIDIQKHLNNLDDKIPLRFKEWGLETEKIKNQLSEKLSESFQAIGGRVLSLTQGLLGLLTQAIICLYLVFFFLRDGKEIIQNLIWVLPIGDDKELQLFQRFESVSRATVKGSLLIAVLQGFVGGLLFLFVGVEGAVLWGSLMVIASLLPVGGAIIWGPIALVYLAQGDYTSGIIIIVVGALLIGLMDNLLRPRLVGNDTKMPDYLILLTTLGGLATFGLSGFVLGPLIAALFITLWQMMGMEFGERGPEGSMNA